MESSSGENEKIIYIIFLFLGYVRGIDPIKQELYIVTPLAFQVLEDVNTLIKGVVNLPNQLLLNQVGFSLITMVTGV